MSVSFPFWQGRNDGPPVEGRSPVPEVLDIAEESKKYDREWLLFEVTEVDEVDRPVKGRLLHHCKSRSEVHREEMKYLDRYTYAFFTGPPAPPDMILAL